MKLGIRVGMKILAAGLLGLLPTTAQACANWPTGTVTMEYIFPPVTYDFKHSYKDLSAVDDGGLETLNHGERRVGLAVSMQHIGSQIKMQTLTTQRTGAVCARVSNLQVRFGFEHNVVYVARELAPNDCIRKDVLGHEYRHVMTNYGILRDYGPYIQSRMQAVVNQLRFVQGTDPNEVSKRMEERIESEMETVMQVVSAENKRRQAQIDTPEEYKRGSRACGGIMQQLLRN